MGLVSNVSLPPNRYCNSVTRKQTLICGRCWFILPAYTCPRNSDSLITEVFFLNLLTKLSMLHKGQARMWVRYMQISFTLEIIVAREGNMHKRKYIEKKGSGPSSRVSHPTVGLQSIPMGLCMSKTKTMDLPCLLLFGPDLQKLY